MDSARPAKHALPPAWGKLADRATALGAAHLRDVVAGRTRGPEHYAVQAGPLLASFARQRLDDGALALLLQLATERDLQRQVADLCAGAIVNLSENRPALHTALRAEPEQSAAAAMAAAERERMLAFAADFSAGRIRGADASFDTLINIGIGGSDLGPRLVVDALHEHRLPGVRVEFVSNLDGQALHRALDGVDPARALFVVASKSFGTVETMTNAVSARHWLEARGCPEPGRHFAAVTTNESAAAALGIAPERIFRMWDWVGGRYSVWSSVGMPIAASLGTAVFLEFLGGARCMDRHFATQAPARNLPVLLGLLDLWNSAFLHAPTRAVVPYDQRLQLLPAYLSQLCMESNGKSVDQHGRAIAFPSAPILWGGVGTDAQHAFFQLLHQGTHTVPVEFLIAARPRHFADHHRPLLAACLAQGQALMEGRTDTGRPWRSTRGNQPSSTFIYDDLTPEVLGMLIALYEHRTFVHAALLDINPFDQWGVELGKEMARNIIHDMEQGEHASADAVTRQLLGHCLGN